MQAVLLLSVTVSGIVGTMCGCVSSMPALMEFYNATNGLTWAQSNGWGSADCNVSWFGVTCTLNEFDGSSRITEVNLTSNNLGGSLTESLVNLTRLQSLLLGSNHISGTLPAKWRMFDFLYQLDVSSNNLYGSIPSNWASVELSLVDFSRNSFNGSLAESFSNNILSIDFSDNQITGSLPTSWASFADICYLSVRRNNLEGTLPESWKTMGTNGSGLVLILSYNHIGGSLPGNWSQLTMIKELRLDHNNLHGPLPESWSTMESHVFFSLVLDSNPIRTTLPSSWKPSPAGGTLTIFDFVAVLSLANCSLYGTLPVSWTFPSIDV
ncbi:GP46-like surface antigen, putative [Bodo saltans]|uniref:GP46-like surface antigen, putative n=1 Tax=Bodo saltans TaxID=75058 RepID=A0A0S4JHM1_BODSA|nr:GP46-like surface antigen, putative [Bodo saltans]|eukprot:CUG89857.1 GP46-like surface antigen, putative [Bodo saltans]